MLAGRREVSPNLIPLLSLHTALQNFCSTSQARSQDFLKGGYVDVYIMCIYAHISKQACKTRGVWGDAASPREFLEIRCSEIASGAIFG